MGKIESLMMKNGRIDKGKQMMAAFILGVKLDSKLEHEKQLNVS